MKLDDIYRRQVSNKGSIYPAQVNNNPALPIRERDPKSIKLEQDVASQMNKAIIDSMPKPTKQELPPSMFTSPAPVPEPVKFVSFEDAIRELKDIADGKIKP